MKILNCSEIQKLIPHRGPALMLDTVTIDDTGQNAVGWFVVTEKCCEGHFPGLPVMRGVDRIEVAAQTIAVAYLASRLETRWPIFNRSIEINLTGVVHLGDVLQARIKLAESAGRKIVGSVEWFVGKKYVGSIREMSGSLVNKKTLARL